MSMRRLSKLIKARTSPSNPKRWWVHEERRQSAEALGRRDYAKMLSSKAIECAAKPSSHPLVTLTPEMAMVIAKHLEEK